MSLCKTCAPKLTTKHKVEEVLGEGKFGKVFRVSNHRHPRFAKTIALKELPMSFMDYYYSKREQFWLRSGQKDHDNLVFLLGYAEQFHWIISSKCVGHFYVEMEACHKKHLRNWLNENMETIVPKVVRPLYHMRRWIGQLLSGLSYMHFFGLIHRDLKPENIYFKQIQNSPYGIEGSLKIGDFGLMQRCYTGREPVLQDAGEEVREYEKGYGTSLYDAPEKMERKYNNKVDIFAVGLIALELIVPFKRDPARNTVFNLLKQGNGWKAMSMQPEEVRDFLKLATNPDHNLRPRASDLRKHRFFDL